MPVTCPCYHQSANSGHTVSRHEVRERHYLKDVAQLAELESKGADIPPELTTALEENEAITAAKQAGRKRGVQAASSSASAPGSAPVSAQASPRRPSSSAQREEEEEAEALLLDSDSDFDELMSPDERDLPFFPKVPPPTNSATEAGPHAEPPFMPAAPARSPSLQSNPPAQAQAQDQGSPSNNIPVAELSKEALVHLASLLTRESAANKEKIRGLETRVSDLVAKLSLERAAMTKEREEFKKERQAWYSESRPSGAAAASSSAVAGPSTYAQSPASLTAQSLYTSVASPEVAAAPPSALRQYTAVVENAHASTSNSKYTFENPSPDVIWSTKDIKRVLGRSESSHTFGVAPEQIIRDHHGVQVPNARFLEIQGDLIKRLATLEAKFKPTPKFERANLKYFDTFHREELDQLCVDAEEAYPELALCKSHFKARFIIMKYFIKLRMSTYDKKRRRLADSTIAKLAAAGKSIEDRGIETGNNKRTAYTSGNSSTPSRNAPQASSSKAASKRAAAQQQAADGMSNSFIHKYKSV